MVRGSGSNRFCRPGRSTLRGGRDDRRHRCSFRRILATLGAELIEAASITLPLLGRGLTAEQIVADPALATRLRDAIGALRGGIA